MGSFIRQIKKQQARDAFFDGLIFDKEKIPELLFLGELSHVEEPMDDGRVMALDIITYEGKRYVMKQEYKRRWFGSYDDI